MSDPLKIDVITIFPSTLNGFLSESMMKRASDNGHLNVRTVNPRDFTSDVHRTTDDRPYGGGPGMVMKPEPIYDAVQSVHTEEAHVVLLSPQGKPFKQADARRLAGVGHLILICGHYEGVDERIRELVVDEELSIGDYVLTNGVLPAAVIIDAVARLRPGVIGGEGATEEESFSHGLLEYPQYTRPPVFHGLEVPDILKSGDHAAIAEWRAEQSRRRTAEKRPDLAE